jgi:hypothetical protein
MRYAILCLAILQPTIRSTLRVDITTDDITNHYPLCSIWCHSNRLSAVLSLVLLQPTVLCAQLCLATLQPTILCTLPADITTDNPPLYPAFRYYNEQSTLLSLALLQPTIYSTDYPLCSLWRYSNRLSILSTIRFALSGVTVTDFGECSTLSSDTRSDYPLYFTCR